MSPTVPAPRSGAARAITVLTVGLLLAALGWWARRDGTVVLDHGRGDDQSVLALAVLPDGRLVAVHDEGVLRIWDPDSGDDEALPGHLLASAAIAVLPDGRFAVPGVPGDLDIWTPGRGSPESITVQAGFVEVLTTTAVGQLASVAAGHLRLADASGRVSVAIDDPALETGAIVALPDGRVATGEANGDVHVWAGAVGSTGAVAISLSRVAIHALVALPDGRVAAGGSDGVIRLFDPDDPAAAPQEIGSVEASAYSLAVLEDGRLASGWSDGRVRIYEVDRPDHDPLVVTCHGTIAALAVLHDGRLAAGSVDGTIRLLDVA